MKACVTIVYLLVALSTLSACGPKPVRASIDDLPQHLMSSPALEAQCNELYGKNKRGKRISWKGRLPGEFSFDEAFPKDFEVAVRSAVTTWNSAAGYEVFRVSPSPRAASVPGNDGQNTFYFIAAGARESSLRGAIGDTLDHDGGLASAILSGQGNRIADVDVVFDGVNHAFTTSRVHLDTYDVESVALHELGHALGLDHNPSSSSTMYYGLSWLTVSLRQLDATTVQMLACEYP